MKKWILLLVLFNIFLYLIHPFVFYIGLAIEFAILIGYLVRFPQYLWMLVSIFYMVVQLTAFETRTAFIFIRERTVGVINFLLIIAFLLYLFSWSNIKKKRLMYEKVKDEMLIMEILFLYLIICVGMGFIMGYSLKRIFKDFLYISGMLSFPIVVFSARKRDFIPILGFLLLGGVIIIFQYIQTIRIFSIISPFRTRIYTRHGQVALFFFSLGIPLLIWGDGKEKRWSFPFILISIPIAFLTHSRALWIAMGLSILSGFLLGLFLRRKKAKQALLWMGLSLLVIFIFVLLGINLIKAHLGERFLSQIIARFQTIETLTTQYTFKVRISDIEYVWKYKLRNPFRFLFGWGCGDEIQGSLITIGMKWTMDLGYLLFMWKYGFLGLVIFLILMWKLLTRLFRFTINSQDTWALSTINFLLAFLLHAFTVSSLTSRRFIVLYYGFIGLVYAYYLRKEEE